MCMGDWDAALYHRVSEPQLRWGLEVLDRLPLRGDEAVLDAGCGSGRLTEELLRRLPRGRVVAVDLSPAMAAQTFRRLRHGPGPLDVARCDLAHLPFAGTFDVVFSTATLHWVLDQDRLFRELHGALKPHGRLHAQCGGGANVKRLHDRALALMQTPPYKEHFAQWREPWVFQAEAEALHRLEQAGFWKAKAWLEERPTRLPDAETYRAFVAGIVLRPHLSYLPEGLRGPFMDRIAAAAATDDPPFTLDYWRLNIEATA